MLRITIISFMVSAALAHTLTPTPTPEDPSMLLEVSRTPDNKTKGIRNTPITLPVGSCFGQTGGGLDSQTLFLLLSLVGSGTGTGIDNNFLSNPFLLFLLLGNNNSNTNSNNNDLLLYLFHLSSNGGLSGSGGLSTTPSGGLGFGQDNLFSNPFILFTLLGNSGSSSSSLNDLLPILLLSRGGLGGDPNNPNGGLTSILPLLLLTNSSILGSSSSGSDNNLLLLLLLSGGLGGSDPNGGGLGSILPLLLLTNSSLLSSSGSGSNNNLLLLFLLSGGFGGTGGLADPNSLSGLGGGLRSILPLLLSTNSGLLGSSGSNDNLLPILLLSGGLGGSGTLAQWTPTPEDLNKLSEFSRTPDNKTKGIRNTPITLPVGSSCLQDSDCDDGFSCFNISHALFDFLNRTSHLNELEFLAKKARITGNECVVESRALFENFTAEQYIERAMELVAKINRTISDAEGFPKLIYDREKLNIKFPNLTDIQKLIQKFNLTELRKPLARQTAGFGQTADDLDTNTLFLLLALRGSGTSSVLDNNLLILLLLSGQEGSIDNNFLSNPFLLFLLLGNDNSNTNSNNNNLLSYLLLLSPNGGLGGKGRVSSTLLTALGFGQDNLFSHSLNIFTLLSNSWISSSNFKDLLPILLQSKLGSGGNLNNRLSSFFLMQIDATTSTLDSSCSELYNGFLLSTLLFDDDGLGGTGAGGLADPNSQSGFGILRSVTPTFLLTNSSFLGSSGSNEDLWPIFLLSGGFGGGFGESGVKSLLPFILLNNNSGSNDNTLLLIFFLTLFNQPGATRLFSQQPIVPPQPPVPPQPIVYPQPPVPPRRLLPPIPIPPPRRLLPPIPIPPPRRLHPAIAIPPPPTTLPSQSTPTPRPTLPPQGNITVG